MIKATEAHAQSVEYKSKNAVKNVELSIKKAIQKGQSETKFICAYDLVDSITEILSKAGYKVSQIQGGIKIYWG